MPRQKQHFPLSFETSVLEVYPCKIARLNSVRIRWLFTATVLRRQTIEGLPTEHRVSPHTKFDSLPKNEMQDSMVFPQCTNERPTARISLAHARTDQSLPRHKWFTLAIGALLPVRWFTAPTDIAPAGLLLFSERNFRHYFVPA